MKHFLQEPVQGYLFLKDFYEECSYSGISCVLIAVMTVYAKMRYYSFVIITRVIHHNIYDTRDMIRIMLRVGRLYGF